MSLAVCAVIASHRDIEVMRDQTRFHAVQLRQQVFRHHHRVGAGAFGKSNAHCRYPVPVTAVIRHFHPYPVLLRARADHHAGDVAHIDRAVIARRHQQQADIGNAGQRLAGVDVLHDVVVAHAACQKGAVGLANLLHELLQRDAVERELFRIGLDPDLLRAAARNVGQAHILGLVELELQFACNLINVLLGPPRRGVGLGRKRQHHHCHVIDAAADDQRLGDADRDAVHIGADFLVDAQDGVIGVGADEEPRRNHHAVVHSLAVDMLDAVDAFDDGFQRLGHQFDGVRGLQAVGVDADVDHGNADLRLFFARDGEERDQSDRQRRQQEQRRQRRADRRLSEAPRQSQFHGRTNTSPFLRPERTSSASGISGRGSSRPR